MKGIRVHWTKISNIIPDRVVCSDCASDIRALIGTYYAEDDIMFSDDELTNGCPNEACINNKLENNNE